MYHNIQSFDEFINDTMRDLNRLAIGFEPTLRRLQTSQNKSNSLTGYPPFNLERVDDNHYRITIAVAGFTIDDLDITVANNQLTISGEIKDRDDSRVYIHKGIAERSFSRNFVLADHVNVTSATLINGMLTLDLVQEIPDALKPKKIPISDSTVIDGKIIENKIKVA